RRGGRNDCVHVLEPRVHSRALCRRQKHRSEEGMKLPVAQAVRAAAIALALGAAVHAQPPAPVERVSFQEAVRRAIDKNPSVAAAAAGILRAEGLLRQARSATGLQVTGNLTTTTLNTGVDFDGSVVTPRNQVAASLT